MNIRNVSPRGRITYFNRDQPHAVYRISDGLRRVIYIGSSYSPDARIATQCSDRGWHIGDLTWTVEWHPDWRTANRVEHAAIWRVDPDFNFVGTALSAIVNRARFGPGGPAAAEGLIAQARRLRKARIAAEKSRDSTGAAAALAEFRELAAHLGVPSNRVQQIAEGRSAGGQGGGKTEAAE
ncbi:hypothetical protein ABT369_39395 [Dactylosporangium sp. NPDC000244]|uniref:hypothetical protein n=1 Tax=Dactylosporangium sp. NPDC000244 TaxID=3154365 RepID=UPI0033226253